MISGKYILHMDVTKNEHYIILTNLQTLANSLSVSHYWDCKNIDLFLDVKSFTHL